MSMDISYDEQYLWYYDEEGNYTQVRDPRDRERYRNWMLWHGSSDAIGKKWYNKKYKGENPYENIIRAQAMGKLLLVGLGFILLEKVW